MRMLPTGTSINRSGFTLVELVVVIAILSLIASISLPLLARWETGSEHQKMRRIVGCVKQLYNEATLTGDHHLLSFDLDRNSMRGYRLRPSSGTVEKEFFGREIRLAPLQIEEVKVAGKGSFRTGKVEIEVFPLGWIEATKIVVIGEDGRETQLQISPLTGAVTIDAGRAQER